MIRKAAAVINGILVVFITAGKVRAMSEGNIIYIREVNAESLWCMVFTMMQHVWKNVLSVCIAAMATVLMVILAIRHKNGSIKGNS